MNSDCIRFRKQLWHHSIIRWLFSLAEKMYLRLSDILSMNGSDYPAYIDLLNRMAVNYQVRSNYQEAEAIFNKLREVYARRWANKVRAMKIY